MCHGEFTQGSARPLFLKTNFSLILIDGMATRSVNQNQMVFPMGPCLQSWQWWCAPHPTYTNTTPHHASRNAPYPPPTLLLLNPPKEQLPPSVKKHNVVEVLDLRRVSTRDKIPSTSANGAIGSANSSKTRHKGAKPAPRHHTTPHTPRYFLSGLPSPPPIYIPRCPVIDFGGGCLSRSHPPQGHAHGAPLWGIFLFR